MERSKLERFNDKILTKIIRNILKDFDGDEWENPFDESSEYYENYVSNISALGINVETIDVDYMYSLIKLNIRDDFKTPLNRPTLAKYSQNVGIEMRVIQTEVYKNIVYSYDMSIVTEKFRFEENEGFTSVYDGEVIDTINHDSESYDWNYYSPKKIKDV
jgi:hypothetical protein